jgi:hypothetical protein
MVEVTATTTVACLVTLGPTQPLSKGSKILTSGVKQKGGEANHFPPFSAKVICGAMPPLSPYVCMEWCLIKHQGQLYLRNLSDVFSVQCGLKQWDVFDSV